MTATVWGDGTPNEAVEIPPASLINEQAGNYVILTSDAHKIIDYIGTGNAIFTLPASVFAGNGFVVNVRNSSAAGVLTLASSGADTVQSLASVNVANGSTNQLILKGTNYGILFGDEVIVAASVPFTPTGTVAANNVQAAIAELDTEKAGVAGNSGQAFNALNFIGAGTGLTGTAAALSVGGSASSADAKVRSFTATQVAGSLVIAAQDHYAEFRDVNLAAGVMTGVVITSMPSLTIPSGATLGCPSGIAADIMVLEYLVAGAAKLCVVNLASAFNLNEEGLISPTLIDTNADSALVVYAEAAAANVPYRVLGKVKAVNAAGVWSNPILVQGAGGKAVAIPQKAYIKMHTANGYGTTETVIRKFTTMQIDQGLGDITGFLGSATQGASFTINTAGMYVVSNLDNFNAAGDLGISKNSTQLTTSIASIAIADKLAETTTALAGYRGNCSVAAWLVPGDVVRPHTGGAASSSTTAIFSIAKVS